MFKLFRKQPQQTDADTQESESQNSAKPSLFKRLKSGLGRTRSGLSQNLANAILGKKYIDEALLEEIETCLLTADVGVDATDDIINQLTQSLKRKESNNSDALFAQLKSSLHGLLKPCEKPLEIAENPKQTFVILMVGVNGAGKTTTIGKLAKRFQQAGHSVMLAAGDTFRAAAVEQLQIWGERNKIPVIAQHIGADSAAVIYDAFEAACARNIDILIADTAGRLHTKDNLMEELKKINRVMKKIDDNAPHEVMLVLDASMGQNAVQQALQFHEAVNVTGISLTKLDGTAKGGVIFSIGKKLGLPIRFIGIGEGIDDLRPFSSEPFIEALFSDITQESHPDATV